MSDERQVLIDVLTGALRAMRVLVHIDNGQCSYCHGQWLYRAISRSKMEEPRVFDGDHRLDCHVHTMRQMVRTLDRFAPNDNTAVWLLPATGQPFKRTTFAKLDRGERETMTWDDDGQRWTAGYPF